VSDFIGFLVCTVLSLGTIVALFRVGLRDGDVFGDALVRVRPLRLASGGGTMLYAEIEIDNQNDSPVMVRARLRPASALTLFFVEPVGRRTALTHRDRPAGAELLGAVDGRGVRRFLLPAPSAGVRALRVTAIVDQVGGRTRVVTTTVRVSHALDGVLPVVRDVTPRR
jgi:hypothetical protein